MERIIEDNFTFGNCLGGIPRFSYIYGTIYMVIYVILSIDKSRVLWYTYLCKRLILKLFTDKYKYYKLLFPGGKRMKKSLVLGLVLVVVSFGSGCSKVDSPVGAFSASQSSSEEQVVAVQQPLPIDNSVDDAAIIFLEVTDIGNLTIKDGETVLEGAILSIVSLDGFSLAETQPMTDAGGHPRLQGAPLEGGRYMAIVSKGQEKITIYFKII